MPVLNYAGQTIREEAIYNKELMGQDRGGMSVPGANEEERWWWRVQSMGSTAGPARCSLLLVTLRLHFM